MMLSRRGRARATVSLSGESLHFGNLLLQQLFLSTSTPLNQSQRNALTGLLTQVVQSVLDDAINGGLPAFPIPTFALPAAAADFGLPADSDAAAGAIEDAFARARAGRLVEVGCLGGRGRTGTVLACMAVLSGVSGTDAVAWVRRAYHPRAVETPEQERWVRWFAEHHAGATLDS